MKQDQINVSCAGEGPCGSSSKCLRVRFGLGYARIAKGIWRAGCWHGEGSGKAESERRRRAIGCPIRRGTDGWDLVVIRWKGAEQRAEEICLTRQPPPAACGYSHFRAIDRACPWSPDTFDSTSLIMASNTPMYPTHVK